jgi:hypothetical protein
MEISDSIKIVAALRKCVNLKELRGIHGWLISDCSFRLEKFEDILYPVAWWDGVWMTQTRICIPSLPYCPPSLENQLPELIALRTVLHTLPPTILPARPLQRVETEFYPDFAPLRCSQTLMVLNLQGPSARFLFSVPGNLATLGDSFLVLLHSNVIEQVRAVHFCGLLFDSETSFVSQDPHNHYHVHTPTPILQEKFRKLQTFVLCAL